MDKRYLMLYRWYHGGYPIGDFLTAVVQDKFSEALRRRETMYTKEERQEPTDELIEWVDFMLALWEIKRLLEVKDGRTTK